MKKTILVGLAVSVFGMNTWAAEAAQSEKPMLSEARHHAFNICPVAIAFGVLSVNYEYLFDRTHGFVIRGEAASLSDSGIDAANRAVVLNYRRHFDDSMESLFAGPYIRYRVNEGSGKAGGTAFDFDTEEVTAGINVGKRWVWESGLNLVVAFGYGVYTSTESVSPSNSAVRSKLDDFKDKNNGFFDDPAYSEFSIGYAF